MRYKLGQAYLYKPENVKVTYQGDFSGFLGFQRDNDTWVYVWVGDAEYEIGAWVEPEPTPEEPVEEPTDAEVA